MRTEVVRQRDFETRRCGKRHRVGSVTNGLDCSASRGIRSDCNRQRVAQRAALCIGLLARGEGDDLILHTSKPLIAGLSPTCQPEEQTLLEPERRLQAVCRFNHLGRSDTHRVSELRHELLVVGASDTRAAARRLIPQAGPRMRLDWSH